MKIGLLVPSISHDQSVETPTIRLLADELGRLADLVVYPLRYPSAGRMMATSPYRTHPTGGQGRRFRRIVRDTIRAIRQEHRSTRFDALHAIWLHEPGTVALTAGVLHRLPVLSSIGGAEVASLPVIGYGGQLSARGRFVARLVLRRSALVSGGSDYVLRLANQVHQRNDAVVAPLPVDTNEFCPAGPWARPEPSTPRLLHAASLVPVKDQMTLLRAFRAVTDSIPGASLTIAGSDPLEHRGALEQLTAELNIADRVTFTGRLSQSALLALYRSNDLFVLSSLHESQAMVVVEAAAAGLPVVGTDVGVVSEFTPRGAGTAPVGDDRALARSVLAALASPERLGEASAAGIQRAREFYSGEVVARRFLRLYEEMVSGRQ